MDETAQHGATVVAATVKWGGATAAALGAVTFTEWLGICGLIVAIIGTFAQIWINFHYKRKEDRRETERHEAIKAGWTE